MNKDKVLFHLREAKEQLDDTIKSLETNNEYDFDLYNDLEHIYSHINSAWNGRNKGYEEEETDEEYSKNRQFPTDIDMSA